MKTLSGGSPSKHPRYVPGNSEELIPDREGRWPLLLASNENPLGPSPLALDAVRGALAESHRYPDSSGRLLREALAAKWSLPANQVLLGYGSTELVELLARAHSGADSVTVLSRQTFIMYRIAVQAAGGRVREVSLRQDRYDLPQMGAACGSDASLVFIANPNNPTGTYVTKEELDDYFRRVPDRVLTVLDEAYAEYLDRPDYPSGLEFLRQGKRVVVLRTFSKAYGLAGLRLGYALGSEDIVSTLERLRSPFNTSRMAQAAGLAALADSEHLARSQESNRIGLRLLEDQLKILGIRFTPSVGNFLLVHGSRSGDEICQALRQLGVIVRPMALYGFPNAVRITVATQPENVRLLEALKTLGSRAGACFF